MARDFDGNDANYLNVGDYASVDITGTVLSLFAWVRFDTMGSPDTIVAKRDNTDNGQYMLSKNENDKLFAHVFNGVGQYDNIGPAATTLIANTWYACLLVKDGTGAGSGKLYLNGIEDHSMTSIYSMTNTTCPFTIGTDSSAFWTAVDGLIAEAAVWDAALSPAEALALAKGVSPQLIRRASLKGYWPLHGTGSPERDYSGNGAHATIQGTVNAGTRHAPVMPYIVPFGSIPVAPYTPANIDADTIYLDLQPSSVEVFDAIDAATVYLDLLASGVDVKEVLDAATVYVDLQASGIEWQAPQVPWWDPLPEGVNKWWKQDANKWREVTPTRFTWNVRGRI